MDRWIDEWMDEWIDKWETNKCVRWVNEWIDGRNGSKKAGVVGWKVNE